MRWPKTNDLALRVGSAPAKAEPPVVASRVALLKAAGKRAETLGAKLHWITCKRADAVASELLQHDLLEFCWAAAASEAEKAADLVIDACFEMGVLDDAKIGDFVRDDFAHFVSSLMTSRYSGAPMTAPAVPHYVAMAGQIASRFAARVKDRRFDFENGRPTALDRYTRSLLKRPAIAISLLVYIIVTSVLGTIGGVTSLHDWLRPAKANQLPGNPTP